MSTPAWATLVRANNPSPMTLEGTNTWVLRAPGQTGCVVVDPGPLLEPHLQAVAEAGPVLVTVLTHGHPDHAEGAARFAEMVGCDVVARDPSLCIGGDPLDTDGESWGAAGVELTTLHTPGHTSDSICLVADVAGERAVLTGDTVLGRGTTVVAHPDGRLADYLDSLARLRFLADVAVLPGHGPVLPDARSAADDYLAHRAERLRQVEAALAAGARTPREVVEVVYADVDRALWDAAELSVRAQLDFLREPP
jgi:glyoxylase-like metal-dependent hydrolase (beta-lactamase superfamily II)